MTPTKRRCNGCARDSTGSRWRSSWRRHGRAHSRRNRSRWGSMTASRCSCAAHVERPPGTRRSKRRSTGVTTCSTSPTGRSSGDWPCSAAGSHSTPPVLCAPAMRVASDDVLPALGSLVDKSLVVVEERRRRVPLPATGDDPALRRASDWTTQTSLPRPAIATSTTCSPSPNPPSRSSTATRMRGAHGSSPSATTSAPHSTGVWRPRTLTVAAAWPRLRRGYGISAAEAKRASSFSSWRSAGRPTIERSSKPACLPASP